ncbi:MAG TPA: glycosyl hydrolase-related protein [Thermoanaerobaculales bacterium]|nr:glycosyl hydrolase-related protein [Thermoanaerobaculales bacterium]
MRRAAVVLAAAAAAILAAGPAGAHDVYLMNSNHTDYNWNATAAQYDAAMLADLDYYLLQIAATAGNPPEEQSRYVPDCWWWLHLYQEHRSPAQFRQLLDAIRSGHITIPLNPFVTLYGALPTEAAIRAGYYPGRIAREFDLGFPLAEYRESATMPWGLASIWGGSDVRFSWKGICNCYQSAPLRNDDELFWWQGPDGKELLVKWYNLIGDNRDWGGYSEARLNLNDPARIDLNITRTQTRMPGIPLTGLFDAGWDEVGYQTTSFVDSAQGYNALGTGNTAIVSNGVDFFEALLSSGVADALNTLRGGWGSDWDMWPASLAGRTARARRAFERMRTAEALAVWAQRHDPNFWTPVRARLEQGLFSAWKYFEHNWDVTAGGPSLAQMQDDKEAWASAFETAVDQSINAADTAISALFSTPSEDRVAVFNPLGFARTDIAEVAVPSPGPYVVTDVATGLEVPAQVIERGGARFLQLIARSVPSLGYKVFAYEPGTPGSFPPAATVTPGTRTIESALYRVRLGGRGQIVEAVHKAPSPDVQLAGANGLNDLGSGTIQSVVAENVGPVSATLRATLASPARTVRITLCSEVDRIDVQDTIDQNVSGFRTYSFHANLPGAQIRFEEVGAIARPGMVTEGGDYLPGTRASRMTLNHFVAFARPDYHLVLSNWDAFAMKLNDSTDSAFDLTGDTVHVVVMEQPTGAGTSDQGGDGFFLNRFALRGVAGAIDAPEAMRTALAHQNPLHVIALPRNQNGPLAAPSAGLLSVDADNVVVTAFKPAEDAWQGYVVRLWELGGEPTVVEIDGSSMGILKAWPSSLIETDTGPAALAAGGVIQVPVDANEIQTFRLGDYLVFRSNLDNGDLADWSSFVE